MEGWLNLPDELLILRAKTGQNAACGGRYQSLVYCFSQLINVNFDLH